MPWTTNDGHETCWKSFMNVQELQRGRLVDHLQLVVQDLAASRRFYEAVLAVLGIPIEGEGDGYFWADELVISVADSEASQGKLTGRVHLAFQAKDRATVESFHKVGLATGGRDNGVPGARPYHPAYYAAFLLDPDGNNIEAVFHGPAQRTADSVSIRFGK
jgi:catechol 2,3-dioxygenase-like lactoylglutathione lyase family enzyme